jgi:hypothetical protein
MQVAMSESTTSCTCVQAIRFHATSSASPDKVMSNQVKASQMVLGLRLLPQSELNQIHQGQMCKRSTSTVDGYHHSKSREQGRRLGSPRRFVVVVGTSGTGTIGQHNFGSRHL